MATKQAEEFSTTPHRPRLTAHAIERWDQRTPADAVAPETALLFSVPVPEKALGLFWTDTGVPDAVRLFCGRADGHRYGVAFVCVEDDIRPEGLAAVTVQNLATAWEPPTQAFSWAFLRQEGHI